MRIFLLTALLGWSPALCDPWDIAHRGGWVDAPENTIVTFNNSIDMGSDWLEIDVWLSLDGVPVIHHDELLDRTTDGTGPVYEKTLAELKLLDAGSYFGLEFTGERIPTLEEVLDTVHLRARLVLDIKKYQYIPTIAALIQSHAFPEENIIGWIRYGTGMADYFKQNLPNSQVLLGTYGPGAFEEYEIWQRATASPFPDLALAVSFLSIKNDRRWTDLVRSYGLLVITGPANMGYPDGLDYDPDGMVVVDPTTLLGLLPGILRECEDGLDNDGDGLTDYPDDPGCFHDKDHHEISPCSDGLDNDGDGLTDYPADPGCFSAFYPFEAPACSNDQDDNGDGLADFPEDPGCFAAFDQREGLACNDGLDNDNDGLFDFPADPGCDSAMDVSEVGIPAGAVPDGGLTPGTPLFVDRAAGDDLLIAWDPSCSLDDDDYILYEGSLGDFTSHVPITCSTGGVTTWTFTPDSDDRYYLAVPRTGGSEGSYGTDGDGVERPVSTAACAEQILGACD